MRVYRGPRRDSVLSAAPEHVYFWYTPKSNFHRDESHPAMDDCQRRIVSGFDLPSKCPVGGRIVSRREGDVHDCRRCTGKMSKKKLNELSLEKKMVVIERIDSGKSQRAVAKEFDIAKTTVLNIWKNRERIREAYSMNGSAKRRRTTRHEELDKKVYEFYRLCRAKNIPVNGAMLQEKARIISKSLRIEDFAASNGWLMSFRSRHNIHFKSPGEDQCTGVEDWKEKFPELVSCYEPQMILNTDGSGDEATEAAACDADAILKQVLHGKPGEEVDNEGSRCIVSHEEAQRCADLLISYAEAYSESLLRKMTAVQREVNEICGSSKEKRRTSALS